MNERDRLALETALKGGSQADLDALYTEPGMPDPSVGLPEQATASIPYATDWRDDATAARDAAVASMPEQVSHLGPAGSYDPLAAEGQRRRMTANPSVGVRPDERQARQTKLEGAAEGAPEPRKVAKPLLAPESEPLTDAGPLAEGDTDPELLDIPGGKGPEAPEPMRPRYSAPRAVTVGSDTFQPVARTVRPGIDVPPEELDYMRAGQEGERENVQALQDAQEYARRATGRAKTQAQDRLKEIDAEYQRTQNSRDMALETMAIDTENALQEYKESEAIDPKRGWANASTGEKIGLAIATFLSGLAGHRPGENIGLTRMREIINQDIDVQKEERQKKRDILAEKKSHYAMASDRFATEEARDSFARLMAYEQVNRQLESFAEHAKSPEQQAQAALARDQLEKEMQAERLNLHQSMQDEITVQERFLPKRTVMVGGGGGAPSRKEYRKQLKEEAEIQKLERELQSEDPLLIPGYGRAPDLETAKAAREVIIANKNFNAQLDEMKRLRKTGGKQGVFGVGTEEYKQLQAVGGEAAYNYARMRTGPGVLTEAEVEGAKKDMGDPTGWGSGFEAREKALRKAAAQRTENSLRTLIPGYKSGSKK